MAAINPSNPSTNPAISSGQWMKVIDEFNANNFVTYTSLDCDFDLQAGEKEYICFNTKMGNFECGNHKSDPSTWQKATIEKIIEVAQHHLASNTVEELLKVNKAFVLIFGRVTNKALENTGKYYFILERMKVFLGEIFSRVMGRISEKHLTPLFEKLDALTKKIDLLGLAQPMQRVLQLKIALEDKIKSQKKTIIGNVSNPDECEKLILSQFASIINEIDRLEEEVNKKYAEDREEAEKKAKNKSSVNLATLLKNHDCTRLKESSTSQEAVPGEIVKLRKLLTSIKETLKPPARLLATFNALMGRFDQAITDLQNSLNNRNEVTEICGGFEIIILKNSLTTFGQNLIPKLEEEDKKFFTKAMDKISKRVDDSNHLLLVLSEMVNNASYLQLSAISDFIKKSTSLVEQNGSLFESLKKQEKTYSEAIQNLEKNSATLQCHIEGWKEFVLYMRQFRSQILLLKATDNLQDDPDEKEVYDETIKQLDEAFRSSLIAYNEEKGSDVIKEIDRLRTKIMKMHTDKVSKIVKEREQVQEKMKLIDRYVVQINHQIESYFKELKTYITKLPTTIFRYFEGKKSELTISQKGINEFIKARDSAKLDDILNNLRKMDIELQPIKHFMHDVFDQIKSMTLEQAALYGRLLEINKFSCLALKDILTNLFTEIQKSQLETVLKSSRAKFTEIIENLNKVYVEEREREAKRKAEEEQRRAEEERRRAEEEARRAYQERNQSFNVLLSSFFAEINKTAPAQPTKQSVKAVFRKWALKNHPDKLIGALTKCDKAVAEQKMRAATEKFQTVSGFYDKLKVSSELPD